MFFKSNITPLSQKLQTLKQRFTTTNFLYSKWKLIAWCLRWEHGVSWEKIIHGYRDLSCVQELWEGRKEGRCSQRLPDEYSQGAHIWVTRSVSCTVVTYSWLLHLSQDLVGVGRPPCCSVLWGRGSLTLGQSWCLEEHQAPDKLVSQGPGWDTCLKNWLCMESSLSGRLCNTLGGFSTCQMRRSMRGVTFWSSSWTCPASGGWSWTSVEDSRGKEWFIIV